MSFARVIVKNTGNGEKSVILPKGLMETTIRINTDMLTMDIMEGIKKMFPHKTIEITVPPADDTDYILSSPAYTKELQDRISSYKQKSNIVCNVWNQMK